MITWIAGVTAALIAAVIIAPMSCKKLFTKLKGGDDQC